MDQESRHELAGSSVQVLTRWKLRHQLGLLPHLRLSTLPSSSSVLAEIISLWLWNKSPVCAVLRTVHNLAICFLPQVYQETLWTLHLNLFAWLIFYLTNKKLAINIIIEVILHNIHSPAHAWWGRDYIKVWVIWGAWVA